jgi:hypothetical protein
MKSITIKRWVLSSHALQRVQERKISANELALVVSSPDSVLSQGPKYIFTKHFQNRDDNLVAAVLLEKKEHDLWVVITVLINFQEK